LITSSRARLCNVDDRVAYLIRKWNSSKRFKCFGSENAK
jgi:hypothetical protein